MALCMAACVLLCACAPQQDAGKAAQSGGGAQQSVRLPEEQTPETPEQPADQPETPDPETPKPQTQTPQTQTPQTPQVTLSIRCDTLADNLDELEEGKAGLVPQDGVILAETALALTEGETVFDVLKRAVRDAGIHMEHSSTPLYASAYIEGIANLYEFDCGPLSGWMYRVNGEFPNYGCSKYELKDGDVIEWLYTCDLGADIGGEGAYSGQRE